MPTPPPRRSATLCLLTLTLLVSFIDRNLLSTMFEPLNKELGLTDSQLGFLSGVAFSVCGALFGLAMGWLTDRLNRKHLLVCGITVWSLATAAQGLATSYWQLLLTRVLVGIGEATGGPVAHSMICDLFPPDERGRALSVWNTAIPAGTLLGLLLGGGITGSLGWRAAFIIVGLPGVVLAALVGLCAREPVRGGTERPHEELLESDDEGWSAMLTPTSSPAEGAAEQLARAKRQEEGELLLSGGAAGGSEVRTGGGVGVEEVPMPPLEVLLLLCKRRAFWHIRLGKALRTIVILSRFACRPSR